MKSEVIEDPKVGSYFCVSPNLDHSREVADGVLAHFSH